MNPDTTPLAYVFMETLALEATTDHQHYLQEMAALQLDGLAGLDAMLDLEATGYHELEK